MEAAYYDNIIEQQRIEPEFFRMGFYGRKFPFFLRVRLTKSSLCPDTVMILLMRSAALLSQLETMSAAVACVGQKAGMLMLILRMRLKSMNISTLSQRVKLNPFLLQFLITCMLFTV